MTEQQWVSESSDGRWLITIGHCPRRRVLYTMTTGLAHLWLPDLYSTYPVTPQDSASRIIVGARDIMAIVSDTVATHAAEAVLDDVIHEVSRPARGDARITFYLRKVAPPERPWFIPRAVPFRRVEIVDLEGTVQAMAQHAGISPRGSASTT